MLWASMKTTSSARPSLPLRGLAVAPGNPQSSKLRNSCSRRAASAWSSSISARQLRSLTYASSLRIARAAERSGAAVIAIAPWRMCGTFAALSIAASRAETSFSRLAPGSPVMFDGLAVDAMVARNKMGGTGRHVRVRALVDPIPNPFEAHPHLDGKEFPVRISASS